MKKTNHSIKSAICLLSCCVCLIAACGPKAPDSSSGLDAVYGFDDRENDAGAAQSLVGLIERAGMPLCNAVLAGKNLAVMPASCLPDLSNNPVLKFVGPGSNPDTRRIDVKAIVPLVAGSIPEMLVLTLARHPAPQDAYVTYFGAPSTPKRLDLIAMRGNATWGVHRACRLRGTAPTLAASTFTHDCDADVNAVGAFITASQSLVPIGVNLGAASGDGWFDRFTDANEGRAVAWSPIEAAIKSFRQQTESLPTCRIVAAPTEVPAGVTTHIKLETTGHVYTTSLKTGDTQVQGTEMTLKPTSPITVKGHVSGRVGEADCSLDLTVAGAPPPPTCSASPSSFNFNGDFTDVSILKTGYVESVTTIIRDKPSDPREWPWDQASQTLNFYDGDFGNYQWDNSLSREVPLTFVVRGPGGEGKCAATAHVVKPTCELDVKIGREDPHNDNRREVTISLKNHGAGRGEILKKDYPGANQGSILGETYGDTECYSGDSFYIEGSVAGPTGYGTCGREVRCPQW